MCFMYAVTWFLEKILWYFKSDSEHLLKLTRSEGFLAVNFKLPYKKKLFYFVVSVTYPEFFLGRPVHTSNPWRLHHGWCRACTFSKLVPRNNQKMHSLALSVRRFLCKMFFKLRKFTLQNTLRPGYAPECSIFLWKLVAWC